MKRNFNPRSLAGATILPVISSKRLLEFQSTLPRGSDLMLSVILELVLYFNPRSLAGATSITSL